MVTSNNQADLLYRIDQLNEIGVALSSEKNIHRLLGTILDFAMDITGADGGTLYLVEDEKELQFEIIRNRSMGLSVIGNSGGRGFNPIPLYDSNGKPNHRTVAAYAVLKDRSVNLKDAYDAEEFDFSGTRQFDAENNYRSKSFLTVPLKDHKNTIIGALQLINAMNPGSGEVIPFSRQNQHLVESVSSQAAVALTTRRLINDLSNLFESFISMIATAIDEKSPYTGAHCRSLPVITMMLAQAVSRTTTGPMRDFHMDQADEYELHVAAMLHDCGKITTPVHVMDKATKLETIHNRIETIDMRFEVVKRDVKIRALEQSLAAARNGQQDHIPGIQHQVKAELEQIETDQKRVRHCNVGSEYMADEMQDEIRRIGAREWTNADGETLPFLSEDELENLLIRKGTLTLAERKIINHHIVSTIDMLESLPFPKHLRNVAEYAGGHHERMDGKGYPKGLTREQMSVQARIMGIADVFEALSSRNRPYKQIKKLSECLSILGHMRRDGHIDPDLFEIFVRDKVYLEYAKRYMNPEQVDTVDEEQVLAPATGKVS